ncbi:MAG: metalloregulator ArsR/SmtB family transcription factor [Eubacteriales bacterium]|nr:metalloregulator ArsR/SmtB family transcription factor [Eubacteriales bacterium]MDD4768589.1 metalloregulator ArsR/SmtB family transcription factor [Eubacteriales bacterium]
MHVKIDENSSFIYWEDIELMFAAQSILQDEPVHDLCSQIYGPDKIAALKRKYHFLYEVFKTLEPNFVHGMLQPLLTYPLADFTLDEYRRHLQQMEPAEFIQVFFSLTDANTADIANAINTDKALEALYFERSYLCNSYLGFQSLLRQSQRYIEEYFSLVEELRTETFAEMIKAAGPDVTELLNQVKAGLEDMPYLEFSQQLMGKTFRNRGPYVSFIFAPSLFLPYRVLRLFGRDQILFISIRDETLQDDAMLQQLKAIADSTRFKIISLLGESPLRGLDIAEALSLAPSTVSHHMEQLKQAGLINEEQVKNSKYYSLSKNNIQALISRLSKTLGK